MEVFLYKRLYFVLFNNKDIQRSYLKVQCSWRQDQTVRLTVAAEQCCHPAAEYSGHRLTNLAAEVADPARWTAAVDYLHPGDIGNYRYVLRFEQDNGD